MILMQLYYNSGFSWSPTDKEPWNTLVSTVPQIGSFIGAFTAYLFIGRSRVTGIITFNMLAIIGVVLIQLINMPLLLLGRFINGYAAGAFSFLIPLMLNEISPPKVRGVVAMLVQFQLTFGVLVPALLGLGLPHYTYEVNHRQVLWRVIAGVPALVAFVQMALFLTLYRFNTPPCCLQNDDIEGAKQGLSLVF